MNTPKWKEFENLVYEIQKDLAGDAEVKKNDFIKGHDSQISRQIDISIRRHIAQYEILVVIDCKDHKTPVDINIVGEFITTVRDVRANKGAIVSSGGFTKNAVTLAKQHGIDTFRLVDTRSKNWKVYATVPTLLERTYLKSYSLRFNFKSRPRLVMKTNLLFLQVFSEDGTLLGTVGEILGRKWNKEGIPHEPGEYEVLLVKNGLVGEERTKATLNATVRVAREFYFGQLPIDVRGFINEQTGGVITRTLTTESMEPFRIEQGLVEGWSRIDDPASLAVEPVMRLAYSDVMPISDEPPKAEPGRIV